MRPRQNPVVGKCWACGEPLRAFDIVRIDDPLVPNGWHRVHRGECEEKAGMLLGPKIEAYEEPPMT